MAQAAEQQLRRDRANRDAARAELDGQIARIRGDLEQRGIGGRIADEAAAKALAAVDDAATIVSESKGVIGGTLALLALWYFRRPIFSALAAMFGTDDETEGPNDHEF